MERKHRFYWMLRSIGLIEPVSWSLSTEKPDWPLPPNAFQIFAGGRNPGIGGASGSAPPGSPLWRLSLGPVPLTQLERHVLPVGSRAGYFLPIPSRRDI